MRVRGLTYIVLIVFLIIFSAISVQAFGISYPYMPDNTLDLYPGQTYMFKLVVQNKDPEDITTHISIDSSIATLVGDSLLDVPGGTYDSHVFFNITVPDDAYLGDTFNINYAVSPTERGEGQIPFAVSYDRSFKVRVVEKPEGLEEPEEEQPLPIPEAPLIPKGVFIVLIIIVMLVLIVFIWRKSRQMSSLIVKAKSAKPESGQLEPKHEPLKPEHAPEQPKSWQPEHPVLPKFEPEPSVPSEPAKKHTKEDKVLAPEEHFLLRQGKNLKNLKELYHALEYMDDETFNHHVNSEKNDFASWIAHSLDKHELADRLFNKSTRKEMLELIKNELEKK